MYLEYYNLSQKPFQITADPKFLWLGEKHAEALATLKYGIQEDKGFLLLTGEVGTGKTALIKMLVRTIDVATLVASVPDPSLEPIDFFNFLAEEFRMDRRFASKGDFLIEFKQFLLKAYSSEKKVLLIIDEAQRLTHDMLEQVRLLSNIELDNRKLIIIFFVGQTEFNRTLLHDRAKAVRQRITVSHHLEPLNERETQQYILHRLKMAGASREIFSLEAMRRIHLFSRGYPRLINIICDHALLNGFAVNAKTIDGQHIQECEKELQLPEMLGSNSLADISAGSAVALPKSDVDPDSEAKAFGWRIPVALIFTLLLAFTVFMIYQYRQEKPQRWSLEDIAPQTYKGLSGVKISDQPFPGTEPEAAAEPQNLPKPPPVAVTGSKGSPEAIATHTLAPNPFAQGKVIIFFPFNSNDLTQEGIEALNQIAAFLKKTPNLKVQIRGYTDAVGSASYNLSVSQFRANSIKSYLIGKGVNPDNLVAMGMGPKSPIATNDTLEGRQQNRRVEIEPAM